MLSFVPRDIKIYCGLCLYGFYKIRRDRQISVTICFPTFSSFSFIALFTAVILGTLNAHCDDDTRPMFPVPHTMRAKVRKTVLLLTSS
jgi:hypothetical protein